MGAYDDTVPGPVGWTTENARERAHDVADTLLAQARESLSVGDTEGATQRFLRAASLFSAQGLSGDAEAARLAAVAALMNHDPRRADELWQGLAAIGDSSGDAAARRGLLGARLSRALGERAEALQRLDMARRGALEVRDAITYLDAVSQAAAVHVERGEPAQAYERLAMGWATLVDLVGREAAARWVRPLMLELRAGLGEEVFRRARADCERAWRGPPNPVDSLRGPL
ncbi:MAG: hypothetical protein ABS53_12570 [Hydrogenophaga sp. SCN 70-13]|mgnify:CR=1 FL=1|uniref:hypothetical protein n=2 Tax=Comamonadaceae TaxID=80864 RepID=UPI000869990E|nr:MULTISPECIES: hypothetical protein [unclassified Hydrogenophaga]MBN9369488.1 hypothetical protein [Hydrogenophaga sp.]ODT30074.1 MAG: hypothetical protein ABS53_12570 [Hydrogenophaga sp. SCN 70-13]